MNIGRIMPAVDHRRAATPAGEPAPALYEHDRPVRPASVSHRRHAAALIRHSAAAPMPRAARARSPVRRPPRPQRRRPRRHREGRRGSATSSSTTRGAHSAPPRPPRTRWARIPCSTPYGASSGWPTPRTPTRQNRTRARIARRTHQPTRLLDDPHSADESTRADEMSPSPIARSLPRRSPPRPGHGLARAREERRGS